MSRQRPEVLAPAGSPDCLPAAVAGGADAGYRGLRHFNARGRAENFRKADLPRHVGYLHGHGLKAYVVLNTLVHDDEFPKALELAHCAHEAGVDAVIVQDLGLWSTLARELPQLPRHSSTQMTVHDASQIAVLAGLGAERVILARELALPEVRRCAEEARRVGVEVEHFVHGALCYAFSGQCLMSNFAGCRSANRGTCAQNCRFDYQREAGFPPTLEVDTELSMKDLQLLDQVGKLADAGVVSLKIEGRLKGPEYVYTVARAYRAAAEVWARGGKALPPVEAAAERARLRDVFARANDGSPLAGEYGPGARLHRYAPEQDREPDAHLVSLDRQRQEGVLRGRTEIRPGQGFAFTVGNFNGGFLVTHVDPAGPGRWRVRVRIEPRGPRLPEGLALFRNVDHARRQEAEAAMARVPLPRPQEGVPVRLRVSGACGQMLRLEAATEDGRTGSVVASEPLQVAEREPLDEAMLQATVGALGGSGFRLAGLVAEIAGRCFMPQSQLKRLRRELVEALHAQVPAAPAAPIAMEAEAAGIDAEPADSLPLRRRETRLWVVVSSPEAARAAGEAGASAVWLDDPRLQLWGARPPAIDRASYGPAELWLRHAAVAPLSPHLAALGLPLVAGHLGVIAAGRAAGLRVIADASCNIFSTRTLAELGRLGAEAGVVSLECSSREIARLAQRVDQASAPKLALIAAGRVPAMLTRQDHGLALGEIGTIRASARDGGLPYQLQRRQHDTVVWEGRRLCAPEHIAQTAGVVDAWVLEFADLEPPAVFALVTAYQALLRGEAEPEAVRRLQADESPEGLFSGHLHQGSRELDEIQGELGPGPT